MQYGCGMQPATYSVNTRISSTLLGTLWLAVVGLLSLPVLSVVGTSLLPDNAAWSVLLEMTRTVLPSYAGTSIGLCVLVAIGVISAGTVTAALVTLFDFPFRKILEWTLLLPLAMPAYVVAYAYTDFLQYSGPLQSWLRAEWGLQGRLLPDIRSLGGAAVVLTLTLYPYVYLLARAALSDRATHLMEAARLLGASLFERTVRVALPMARPAIAAGTALALMETLADFGVSSYFGIQTFATGIYKAWIVLDNRIAAAQLATVLLIVVAVVLHLETRAQAQMRFASSRGYRRANESRPMKLRGIWALVALILCSLPVLLGFVAPVTIISLAYFEADPANIPFERFLAWTTNSLTLGLLTAVLAVAVALALSATARLRPGFAADWAVRLTGLGYAVPGVVIVVGLLLPLGWLQAAAPHWGVGFWLTGTALGLVWAYLTRFSAVALQSIQSGYARMTPQLDDSARMLGASGWRLLVQVHAPQLKKPLAVAALLVLVDVMKELPATLALRPFNSDTLAVMAYQLARDERLGEAALPSLALVVAGLLPVILLSRTLRDK